MSERTDRERFAFFFKSYGCLAVWQAPGSSGIALTLDQFGDDIDAEVSSPDAALDAWRAAVDEAMDKEAS